MEPYYTNTDSNSGMYSMHTVQQPADLNNSLLNQPFNPSATYQHSAQQPTPKKSHPKRYQCTREGCERMFAGPHNVNQHIREAHTGEKPYKCPECTALGHDKAFARPFSCFRSTILGSLLLKKCRSSESEMRPEKEDMKQ